MIIPNPRPQDQLTRSQRTRIGYFEIWNNSFISINLAYLRKIWPPLILSNWYLGTNFFGKGSDTSFTSQVSPPLALCQLILSQDWDHHLMWTSFKITFTTAVMTGRPSSGPSDPYCTIYEYFLTAAAQVFCLRLMVQVRINLESLQKGHLLFWFGFTWCRLTLVLAVIHYYSQ